jgi:hypothetical protein
MMACFVVYGISLFGEGPGPLAKSALILGYLLAVIFFGRTFLKRDTVTWNRKGISIKLGGYFRKSTDLLFQDIRQVESREDQVIIGMVDGRQHTLDLTGIAAGDQQRLAQVLTEYASGQ